MPGRLGTWPRPARDGRGLQGTAPSLGTWGSMWALASSTAPWPLPSPVLSTHFPGLRNLGWAPSPRPCRYCSKKRGWLGVVFFPEASQEDLLRVGLA